MRFGPEDFTPPPVHDLASAPAVMQVSTASVLTGQILVMAMLLERALGVVKNVEAEGCDEGEQLQQLIADGEAAIAAVLQQHAMGVKPA